MADEALVGLIAAGMVLAVVWVLWRARQEKRRTEQMVRDFLADPERQKRQGSAP
jgi:uncharacterized membrane protein YccC